MARLRPLRVLVPLFLLLLLAYLDFVCCYIVAYKQYYLHGQKPAAVALWVLLPIAQIIQLTYWLAIFLRGPGSLPKFPHFDLYGADPVHNTPVPRAFVCDEQGYPFWCSKCQNLKPHRSFHSGDLDRCIPKLDHYCLWIGTAIGRDNYLPFIKFVQILLAYSLLVLCYTAATAHEGLQRNHGDLPHYILLFIAILFIFLFASSLYIMVMVYMAGNLTTLDDITRKQTRKYRGWQRRRERYAKLRFPWLAGKLPREESGIRYLNVAHDGSRVVVPFYVNELQHSLGFRVNLVNTVLNGNKSRNEEVQKLTPGRYARALVFFLIPIIDLFLPKPACLDSEAFTESSDDFSPNFLEKIEKRISKGKFSPASYLAPNIANQHNQPITGSLKSMSSSQAENDVPLPN